MDLLRRDEGLHGQRVQAAPLPQRSPGLARLRGRVHGDFCRLQGTQSRCRCGGISPPPRSWQWRAGAPRSRPRSNPGGGGTQGLASVDGLGAEAGRDGNGGGAAASEEALWAVPARAPYAGSRSSDVSVGPFGPVGPRSGSLANTPARCPPTPSTRTSGHAQPAVDARLEPPPVCGGSNEGDVPRRRRDRRALPLNRPRYISGVMRASS